MGVVNTAQWRGAEVPRPTDTDRPAGWRACTPRCSNRAGCCPPICWPRRPLRSREGYCPILHEDVTFGLGFKPTVPRRPFGPNPGASATSARAGPSASLIPTAGVAFGYVMNDVIPRWQSTRNRSIIDALYRTLSTRRRDGSTSWYAGTAPQRRLTVAFRTIILSSDS